MYVCMYVFMYVCMYVYTYIYKYRERERCMVYGLTPMAQVVNKDAQWSKRGAKQEDRQTDSDQRHSQTDIQQTSLPTQTLTSHANTQSHTQTTLLIQSRSDSLSLFRSRSLSLSLFLSLSLSLFLSLSLSRSLSLSLSVSLSLSHTVPSTPPNTRPSHSHQRCAGEMFFLMGLMGTQRAVHKPEPRWPPWPLGPKQHEPVFGFGGSVP